MRRKTARYALVLVAAALAFPAGAAIVYNDVTSAALVGRAAGADGFIGTADDVPGGGLGNPFGAASYVETDFAGPLADLVSWVAGTLTLDTYSAVPGTGIASSDWSRSATAINSNGTVTFLSDAGAAVPHGLTIGSDRTVTLDYRENHLDFGPSNTQFLLGFTGYTLFNAPGLDDPFTIAGIDGATAAYLNTLKGLVPVGWTQIVLTIMAPTVFTAGVNVTGDLAALFDGAVAHGVGAAYTTDPAALALVAVPLPSAWLAFACGAVLFAAVRRRPS